MIPAGQERIMTIGIRASLSGRLCLYPHVIFSRKDDHFHLIFHFLCPRKQGQIIIHLHSFRAEPLDPAVLRHIPELARLYAVFAAPLHLFPFLHASADPADPDLCQEPAHRKPPAVLRLQSPGEGEALFRIYCFFCKRYCQMSFQINGQKEHHRQKKELGQEEHHQRRALIHPCNIINTKKKGEKCKLRHLRSSPIGGICILSVISLRISCFVFLSISAAPVRRIRCEAT